MAAVRRPAARKAVASGGGARKPAVRKAIARAPRGRKVSTPRSVKAAAARDLRLAGVGTAAVLRKTGRAWDEWLTVLDRAGARLMPHKDIALMLSRKFDVPDWWSQMVTVGYEQARGLRLAGQRADGFAASASRTMGIAVGRLYDAWNDAKTRERWLLDAPVEVRRATDGKSMRMTWTPGASSVEVSFQPRGPGRSQVAVQHGKLASARAARVQKAFWTAALKRLKALLEGGR